MGSITIDSQEYHVGDAVVTGWPPAVGLVWSKTFNLDNVPGTATLVLDVQDAQSPQSQVSLNGLFLGNLALNAQRHYSESRHPINQGVLRTGQNNLSIAVGLLPGQPNAGYDDILIRNVRLEVASVALPLPIYDQVGSRLHQKGYSDLPGGPAPIAVAFFKTSSIFGLGPYVVAIADVRNTTDSPTRIMEKVSEWFSGFLGNNGQGVLLFVYHQALASTVEEVQGLRGLYGRVIAGVYEQTTRKHWLSNLLNWEQEIFGND